jgi:hypothetical protein|tara:strand:- start:584 stop:1588 length:1005 start_codon:yes stop_codon:yes gene_type:complete
MFIKNLKILILLSLGFLVVALGMYFDDKSDSTNSTSEVLFPSFGDVLPNIAYIEFSNQTGKSVIENIDNQWLISSSDNFPANTELLSRFFIQLREAKIIDAKTNREDLLFKLGLDEENKMQLLLKSKNDEVLYSLDIGIYNYNIPGSYVKATDSNQSYLVSTNLSADVSDFYWVPTDLINIGKSQIKSIQIYNQNMINLNTVEGKFIHTNLTSQFNEIDDDKIIDAQNILTDLQHNGFILKSDLPNSPDLKTRFTLNNGTIIFVNLYDIDGKGVHATFNWNYIDDKIQISKFIDPLLDGNQMQVSSVALLNNFAFSVPQIFFDSLNIKLREKQE